MSSDDRKAYAQGDIRPSREPGGQEGRPQREQTTQEKRKRKRRHEQNKAEDNKDALRRYHTDYKRNRKMIKRREEYRKDPDRYERRAPRKYERPDKKAVAQRHAARLWYHGSPDRFEGFQTYEGHTFGKGPSEVPLFFSPSKSFAKMYATGPEGTIYTARLKWRKVFDGADLMTPDGDLWFPDYDEDLTDAGRRLYDDLAEGKVFPGVDEDDLLDGLWRNVVRMDYDIIEDSAFKRWLKKNGYDAAYVTGDGEQNVFVFSPGQVEIIEVEGRWDKRAGDVMLYDQHNPANNEIKQPGLDVNYRAEGPTTYSTEPDEKKGVVPGNRVPNRQLDDVPPASSRVIPDSMKETLQQEYMKSASATVPQILSNCGPEVTGRSRDIKYKRKRLSPSGMSTWIAQSVTDPGKQYIIKVKPIRKDKRRKIVSKMPVRVSCSCPFWRWQGPEHWGKVNDYLYGKPRGTASFPIVRDPKSKHWACKHVIAVLQLVKNYRYASAEESKWSYDGPLAPLPDEGRVAARYMEAKRQLWWHGTSGKNLRSILKQGLIPTGDLVYGIEIDQNRGGRSIKTFGGIYFSSQWFTAYSAAGQANPGRRMPRVVIGATLDNRSPDVLLDEDDMLQGIENVMGRTFDQVARQIRLPEGSVDSWGTPRVGAYGTINRFLLEDADYGDLPSLYLDRMVSMYPKLEGRVERQREALESAIQDVMAAYAAHLLETLYHRFKDKTERKVRDTIEDIPKATYYDEAEKQERISYYEDQLKQHLANEREIKGSFQLLQEATNRLGQMMREATEMPEDAFRHNIRVMRPVTYRGKDRILMVASITDRDSQVWEDSGQRLVTATDITFHYGAQHRKPFLDKYEERVGGIARVLDASGKVLEIIDKRGQLDERGWPTDLWGPAPRAYRDVAASDLTADRLSRRPSSKDDRGER